MASNAPHPMAFLVKWLFFALVTWWYIRNAVELTIAMVVYSSAWHSQFPKTYRWVPLFATLLLAGHSLSGNSIWKIVTLAGILALFNKPFLVIFDFGSPVHILARMGLGKLLPILVKAGFPVDEPTMVSKNTALHYAAYADKADAIKTLVNDCGANLTARDPHNRTPLHAAALALKAASIKALVELKCHVDIKANSSATALHMVSEYPASAGKLETIRALLKQGANANAQDDAGGHAVLRCADKGDDASIKVLLDEGKANIDLAAKSGSTALHIACMRGHTATVKFLLSKGANRKLKLSAAAGPHAGKTPLDLVEPTNTEIRAALGDNLAEETQLGEEILSRDYAKK